jgi:hypothetical protein
VSGVLVQFTVIEGGGLLARDTALTKSDGIGSAEAWILGTPGANAVRASVGNLPPLEFAILAEPAAQIVYELDSVSFGGASLISARLAFRTDGRFTTHVNGVVGFGTWDIVNFSSISFRYSDAFLEELRDSLDFFPLAVDGLLNRREVATITGDAIVMHRCLGEDCYDSYWTFRRTSGSPLPTASP